MQKGHKLMILNLETDRNTILYLYFSGSKQGNEDYGETTVPRWLYIYTSGSGRFGNLLFQYVSSIGIANHNNRIPVFGSRMVSIKEIFPNLEINTTNRWTYWWKKVNEKSAYDFENVFFNLPMENVVLDGFLCSFKYFEEIWSHLSDALLTFNESLTSRVQYFIKNVTKQYMERTGAVAPKSVCVHVRIGDKATQETQLVGYNTATAQDILAAMMYMESTHKHVVFIVASDTKQWCENHLRKDNVYISNMSSYQEDFVLMSSCDHMIMTVGTFGWWAAWLTSRRGGTSMYYNHPFVTGSYLDKMFDSQDHFPADWIPYNRTAVKSN